MKRSEINKALLELEAVCEKYNCYLPPFCHFIPEEWNGKGEEYDEVRECKLGWDITDFGLGNFEKYGFSLITIRNGNQKLSEKYKKVYADKPEKEEWDALEKSVIAAVADDVVVGIKGKEAKITIVKKFA